MSFYSFGNYEAGTLRLRSPNLYQAKHGAYIGLCDRQKQRTFLVLGTTADPVTAPLGVKHFADGDDMTKGYSMLSVALNDDALQDFIAQVDQDILNQLSDNSVAIFHEQYSAAELRKMKYYTPAYYTDNKNGLAPLLGAKLSDDCMVLDADMAPTNEEVLPGAQICCVLSVPSLYFKAPNSCRLTLKCEKIKLVTNGQDTANAVKDFQFM